MLLVGAAPKGVNPPEGDGLPPRGIVGWLWLNTVSVQERYALTMLVPSLFAV